MKIFRCWFYLTLIHYFLYVTDRFCQCNVLNIMYPESYSEYVSVKVTNGDVTSFTYMPTTTDHIYKLMDGGLTIWQSSSISSVLSYLKVHSLMNIPKVCMLHVYNPVSVEELYFAFEGGVWKGIDGFLYECKMRKLYLERSLDITYFSTNSFSHFEQQIHGLPSNIIIPFDKYKLVRVQHDFDIIWEKAHRDEVCTFVVVHGNLRKTKLVNLNIRRLDTCRQVFFAKIGGDWEEISKHYFYKILELLDELEEERKERGDDDDDDEEEED